jgi:biopolymer transport protein ExbD
MMIKKLMLSTLIFFIALPVFAADSMKSLPFKEKSISKAEIRSICQKIKSNYDESSAKLWVVKIAEAEKYYLIDENLQMIQLSKHLGKYQIVDNWNLTKYQQVYVLEENEISKEFIYPALYPLNRHSYAVALVFSSSTSYAGGGRSEQIAQFIQLLPKGKAHRVLKDIPFYSYERIKACFSEQDYKKSSHCHDEHYSILSIDYQDIGKPYYQWNLTYTETDWPAYNAEKKVQKRTVVVIPYRQVI